MGAMANQGEKSRAYRKEREKLQFIEWLALPSWEREPKTQRQLAKKLRVNEVTLSEWAHSEEVGLAVHKLSMHIARKRRPDVLGAIVRTAVKGNPYAQKLFLQYTEGWAEKQKQETEHTDRVVIDFSKVPTETIEDLVKDVDPALRD
jgi:hypothetical protein